MKALEAQFLEFIRRDVQFKIPIYQRLYSWVASDHCQKLIDDIKMLLEHPNYPIHFMGSIVYIDEKGLANLSGTRELLVIDGQQRLTTFTLIFKILEDLARNGNKKFGISADVSLAEKIKENCLFNKYSKLESKSKLILTKTDNSTLQQLLNNGRKSFSSDETVLINNYDYMASQILPLIKEYSLETFYDNLNKLMIVDVGLYQQTDNPQQTFESLNATGKELEDGDLIRNFLLMNLTSERQKFIYENYWYPIEESLGVYLTFFFINFLYMEKGTSTNIKNLYKEFKVYFYDKYESHDNIEELTIKLFEYSKYFNLIICNFENTKDDDRLVAALKSLNRLEFNSYIPLLMPIIHEYRVGHEILNEQKEPEIRKLSLGDLLKIIHYIESFLLRRNICGIPTNSLNPIFRTIWSDIDIDNILYSFCENLIWLEDNKRFPTNEEFLESLMDVPLYNYGNCKLILEELEKFDNKEAPKTFESLQIEHVLPKTNNDPYKLSETWREMLGKNWKEVRNTWIHRLGNLTLTGYNPEYSDYDFNKKKSMKNGLCQSSLRLNQFICKCTTWDENTLKERAEYLSKKIIEIWKYPVLE